MSSVSKGQAEIPFGQLVKRARMEAALTQQELAERTGISVAALRDLEQGRIRKPRPGSVRALASVLGTTPGWLPETRHITHAERDGPRAVRASVATDEVRINILGPLQTLVGASDAGLGAGRHRLVLARLALTPHAAVDREELVDLLWGKDIPGSAVNLVQTYISRLRKALEPHRCVGERSGVLAHESGAYRLCLSPHQLDLLEFRQLTDAALDRSSDHEQALALLGRALDLWRGDPLSDVAELHTDPSVAALLEDRVNAAIHYARLAQKLSRQERALPRLREMVLRYPFHEPLHVRFIAALAATGRQAAALDAYRRIRALLADELGIDPGPELSRVYEDVLHQRWSNLVEGRPIAHPTVPHQAPAPPPDFTGRAALLESLREALSASEESPLCVVSGSAGIGKTTLALKLAQTLRTAFPDGQLFLDLQGAGSAPVRTIDALARMLRSLGVEGRAVPPDEAESASLYRSMLAQRRMLIILDNAKDAAQVRPLLPGAGACAALVTSRGRLADLAGVTLVNLPLFTADESLALLAAMVGRVRVGAEATAAGSLTAACGHLPIALRVAGARLINRPDWTIGHLVRRLDDQRGRLDELKVGDIVVETSFELSYRELPPRLARVFRLLAFAPGQDFGVAGAAAMLDDDPDALEPDLARLVDANLLRSAGEGRYGYHDLLRLFAQRRAWAQESQGAIAEATGRLFEWLLHRVSAAMPFVYPGMVRLPLEVGGGVPGFSDADAAFAWLDTELLGLLAVIDHTAQHGPHRYAWRLADQLRGYFLVRRTTAAQWLATGAAGLQAAEREHDERAAAAMHQTLGQACWSAGRHAEALEHYQRAQRLARRVGWDEATAYLFRGIGQVHLELGRLAEAEESFLQGLQVSRAAEFAYVRAVTLNDLGALCHEQGRLNRALAYFEEALTINQRLGHERSIAVNQNNLGMILRELGRLEQARPLLEASIAAERQTGSQLNTLSSLDELSRLHSQSGEHAQAMSTAREALVLARACHHPRAEAGVLATLGEALLAAGEVDEARGHFLDSQRIAESHSFPFDLIRAHLGLARLDLALGLLESAAQHAGLVTSAARHQGYRMLEEEGLRTADQIRRAHGS